MKKDLVKELKKAGFSFHRDGRNHQYWKKGDNLITIHNGDKLSFRDIKRLRSQIRNGDRTLEVLKNGGQLDLATPIYEEEVLTLSATPPKQEGWFWMDDGEGSIIVFMDDERNIYGMGQEVFTLADVPGAKWAGPIAAPRVN